jgi:hypothetical protein
VNPRNTVLEHERTREDCDPGTSELFRRRNDVVDEETGHWPCREVLPVSDVRAVHLNLPAAGEYEDPTVVVGMVETEAKRSGKELSQSLRGFGSNA